MVAIIDAIKRAFLWTFAGPADALKMVIFTVLGVLLDRLFNAIMDRIGRPARDREQEEIERKQAQKDHEQEERFLAAAREGAREGASQTAKWQQENPGQQIPDRVFQQIIEASTTFVAETLTSVATPHDPIVLTERPMNRTVEIGQKIHGDLAKGVPLPGPAQWVRENPEHPAIHKPKEEPPKK